MTGGYRLLLPSLWVCGLSYILSDEQSIYSSQVEGRANSPAHQGTYVRQVLAKVRVRDFLSPSQETLVLHPSDPLPTVLDRVGAASVPVLPVVDQENRLLGVVNLEEAHLASQLPSLTPLVLAEDLMRTRIRPLMPDDTLDWALELFVEYDLLVLPVVEDLEHCRGIGTARRYEISGAYVRYLHAPRETEGEEYART